MRRLLVLGLVGAAASLAACSAQDSLAGAERSKEAFPGDPSGGTASPAATTDGGAAAERELEDLYEAPVATGRYVWSANPRSGRVAFVDATTLAVRTLEAGHRPTHLAALPCDAPCAEDRVVVLNLGSKNATLVSVGQNVETVTVAVPSGGNRWAVSGKGRYAVAWTDARREASAPKTQGFQDICILDLVSRRSTVLAVGYRPVAVGFASDEGRAYAVTQDGISLVDLSVSPPRLVKNIALSDTPLEDPGSRDVAVTPDGTLAFVRRDGSKDVTVASLSTGVRKVVTFDGPVTDFDLAPAGDRAIAVVRSTSKATVLPVPGVFDDVSAGTTVTLTGETVGSVAFAPTGARALLYTTDATVERVSALDLASQPPGVRTVRLYSPVLAAFLAPAGDYAVAFHPPQTNSLATGQIAAFSLVPLAADLPAKIVATEAPLMNVAIAPEGDKALITERDDRSKVYRASIASFPSLQVDRYPLASPPLAAGVAAQARRAFIAQEHPEGRITFIDFKTGAARTLTGFELAARVVDGSVGK